MMISGVTISYLHASYGTNRKTELAITMYFYHNLRKGITTMEQAQITNTKDLIGHVEKEQFLKIMDALFPEQDLLNEKSMYRKKADATFAIMVRNKWKVKEFRGTMLKFESTHSFTNWMPANIISIWYEEYGRFDDDGYPIEDRMII